MHHGALWPLVLLLLTVTATYSQIASVPAQEPAESEGVNEEGLDEERRPPSSISEAPEGRFPFMCSVRKRGTREHICGGTLVAKRWVLTTAHCIDPQLSSTGSAGLTPIVYCGVDNVNAEVQNLTFAAVDSVMHELWTGNLVNGYDIALIKLESEANLTAPGFNLPGNSIEMNSFLAALGWGETPTDPTPQKLQLKTRLLPVSYATCNHLWNGIIKENIMLCAGIGEKDTCQGDGGGPLLLLDAPRGDIANGNPHFDLLVGLTSFGSSGCGQGTRPGVYTDVGYFADWIKAKISEDH